jgi:hypothetical protein
MNNISASNTAPIKYLQQPAVEGPWPFGLFSRIPQLINSLHVLYKGGKDHEQKLDASVRVISGVPGMLYSAGTLTAITVQYTYLLLNYKLQIPSLSLVLPWMPVMGLVVCAAEILFGIIQMRRSVGSLASIAARLTPEENQEKGKILLRKLQELQKTYYTSEEIGRNKLRSRVEPWCEERIQDQLSDIIYNLVNGNEIEQSIAEIDAEKLLKAIRIQIRKRQITHAISTLLLAICAAGFIAEILVCPPTLVFALVFTGAFGSFASSVCGAAALEREGWTASKRYFVPDWLKFFIRMDTTSKENKRVKKTLKEICPATAEKLALRIKGKYKRGKALLHVLNLAIEQEKSSYELRRIRDLIGTDYHFYRKACAAVDEAIRKQAPLQIR